MTFFIRLFLTVHVLLISCKAHEPASGEVEATDQPVPQFTASTFVSGDGFGFEIMKDRKPVIRQAHIPSIAGNHYFVSESEALSVANLMIEKMKSGIQPPSVTKAELDSLRIHY